MSMTDTQNVPEEIRGHQWWQEFRVKHERLVAAAVRAENFLDENDVSEYPTLAEGDAGYGDDEMSEEWQTWQGLRDALVLLGELTK